jgi:hypothetical protein
MGALGGPKAELTSDGNRKKAGERESSRNKGVVSLETVLLFLKLSFESLVFATWLSLQKIGNILHLHNAWYLCRK